MTNDAFSIPTSSVDAADARRRRQWPAWVLLALTLALGLAAIALFILNRNTAVPATWGANAGLRTDLLSGLNMMGQTIVLPLTASALGALIVGRQPRHRIGWLLIITGVIAASLPLLSELTVYLNFTSPQPSTLARLSAWVQNWIWVVLYSLVIFTIALFPTGHFHSRRWAWITGVVLAFFTMPLLIASATEGVMSSAFQLDNPFVAAPSPALYNGLMGVGVPMMPVAVLVVLLELWRRYRSGDSIQRQQIKWLLASLVGMAIIDAVGLFLALSMGLRVGAIMVNLVLILPLFGIAIGVLRYRLYDIDIIIRRTLVYGLLTATLILIYFGSVTLFSSLITALTGQESPLVIVLSTLLIAALFTPLRRRAQDLIDRRFYRRKYDAAQTLAAFARTARNETDLDVLLQELTRVVDETMQPDSVSVWLISRHER